MSRDHTLAAAFLVTLALTAPGAASDASQVAFNDYCVRRAAAMTGAAAEEIASIDKWNAVKERRRAELQRMLGLYPYPPRTPLNAKVTGTLKRDGYTIEKLAFESMPGMYVSANLYLPAAPGRKPAIVYVCGHKESQFGAKTGYQEPVIILARNGYVTLTIDPIQSAETFSWHHAPSRAGIFDWYSRGYSPASAEVWNAMRALDYLETRPEVDVQRLGMTGRSGGGGMSWLMAALDSRVKVIVPGASIMTYNWNLREYTNIRKCDCMYFGNVYGHDMLHLGALVAPKPVLMIYGKRDPGFPKTYGYFEEKVGALYRAYGKPDALRSMGEDAAHEGTPGQNPAMIRFFNEHLMGEPGRAIDTRAEPLEPAQLLVFNGQPPADSRTHLFSEILPHSFRAPVPATLEQWEKRKVFLLDNLRQHVFPGFRRLPAPELIAGQQTEKGNWIAHTLTTELGVSVAMLLSGGSKDKRGPALLYIASEGETQASVQGLLGRARAAGMVAVVFPRGVSAQPWDEDFRREAMRNALLIGETVDSLRLHDSIQAARALLGHPRVAPASITVSGRGVAASLALYTALLVPEVQQVALLDPPASHRNGPDFLNVMQYTDLPEAAALLAPRRLNFIAHEPESYAAARKVFGLYGHPEHVFVSFSFEGLLAGKYHHGFASEW